MLDQAADGKRIRVSFVLVLGWLVGALMRMRRHCQTSRSRHALATVGATQTYIGGGGRILGRKQLCGTGISCLSYS